MLFGSVLLRKQVFLKTLVCFPAYQRPEVNNVKRSKMPLFIEYSIDGFTGNAFRFENLRFNSFRYSRR